MQDLDASLTQPKRAPAGGWAPSDSEREDPSLCLNLDDGGLISLGMLSSKEILVELQRSPQPVQAEVSVSYTAGLCMLKAELWPQVRGVLCNAAFVAGFGLYHLFHLLCAQSIPVHLAPQQAGGVGGGMASCFLPLPHLPQQLLHLSHTSNTALRRSMPLPPLQSLPAHRSRLKKEL